MIEKMIIFDWSGTLSPEAVRFGEDENLKRELELSGLAALGVATPRTFWKEIVTPTWEEGSTTAAGYVEMIVRRVRDLFTPDLPEARIRDAAASFVDSYLAHSSIDGRWNPVLKRLTEEPSVMVVIATDHYAEATAYLVRSLGEMGIGAIPVTDASGTSPSFVVASSADVGAHKADRPFWEYIRETLRLDAVRSVLLVDDFGFNEAGGDSYGERRKVEARKGATITLLEGVFGAAVSAFPFIWERSGDPVRDERACGDLIARASEEIEAFLSRE